MRFIYILKKQVVLFKGVSSEWASSYFLNRDNAEKALSEWNEKMKDKTYAESYHGYIETAELEDAE